MKAEAALAWVGIIVFGAFTLILSRGAAPVPSPSATSTLAPESLPDLQIVVPKTNVSERIWTEVRVNLSDSPLRTVSLAVDGPYRITPVGNERVLSREKRLAETTIETTSDGFEIGIRKIRGARLEIVPDKSPAIWVNDHQYRGIVRLYRQSDGRIVAVNVLPLEDYVASVLDSEMPADFPKAARDAQAIVARTYALYQLQQTREHPQFDLYSSTRSQKYLGFQYRDSRGRRLAAESASSRQSTSDTAGMVCTYHAQVFGTYYTAVCGGRTTTGREVFSDAAPPLVSVPCEYCRASPRYRWTAEVSRDQLTEVLDSYFASKNQTFGALSSMRISPTSKPDGLPVVEIKDGRRALTMSAADLRNKLPPMTLPSPHFQVRSEGETLHFDGRGHGHGVGFCQWGARGQALAGRGAHDIVRYYYPGSEIVTLDQISR